MRAEGGSSVALCIEYDFTRDYQDSLTSIPHCTRPLNSLSSKYVSRDEQV